MLLLFCFVALAFGGGESHDANVIFSLHVPSANVKNLERLLVDEISNPKSERYAKYLSNEELRDLVGISDLTVSRVTRRLRLLGYKEIRVSHHKDFVWAKGPAVTQTPLTLRSFVSSSYTFDARPAKKMGKSRRAALAARFAKVQSSLGDPVSQRASYGIPQQQTATHGTSIMVWGPGTYGYTPSDLQQFYSTYNVQASINNINTTQYPGVPGGDNFGECTLDVSYSTGIGNGVFAMVSNTNTSMSTEEGDGFGYAFLDFVVQLASAPSVPGGLSLSLGSLSAYSCSQLCTVASQKYGVGLTDCQNYLQQQRQVCMMDSMDQQAQISVQFLKLGLRGVTITAAAGDGGSHFSFVKFDEFSHIGRALNKVSCEYNFPTFPASSPWVLAVGGTQWSGQGSPSAPVAWTSGGSGFSWQFPTPSYQQAQVTAYLAKYNTSSGFPAPGSFNANGRAYPDTAALADNIPLVMQGSIQSTGGTSASAPEWVGVIALLNDIRASKGLPNLGFINTRLYQLNGAGLYDIQIGNSKCAIDTCCDSGFPAAPGWDPMSGWGSPVWQNLVNAFTNN